MSNPKVQHFGKFKNSPPSSPFHQDNSPIPSTSQNVVPVSESRPCLTFCELENVKYPITFNCDYKPYDQNEHRNSKLPKERKRKKIFNKVPEGSIVLGDIIFKVRPDDDNIPYSKNLQYNIIVFDAYDYNCLVLELCYGKDDKYFAYLETLNHHPSDHIINDLLTRNYMWVFDDFDGYKKSLIRMKICIFPEKTPIFKARNIAELFLKKSYQTYDKHIGKNEVSIENFLKEIKLYTKNVHLPDINVQHEQLKSTLCPYQARAVRWMVQRESPNLHPQTSEWKSSVVQEFYSVCSTAMHYNIYTESICSGFLEFPPFPRGGILADEMGLGKTLAVLALILNNPRNMSDETDNGEFFASLNGKTVKKVRPLKSEGKNFDPKHSIKAKNMENCLSPHEELILSKSRKGAAMKRALNKWYESTLAEYSACKPSKRPRTDKNLVKCLCGDFSSNKYDHFLECQICKTLQHPACMGFKENFDYLCPPCWEKQKLVKSGATLIISPTSIYHQWLEEINKHVESGSFSKGILMYDELVSDFLQPSVLASYNIVICTYSRLRAELNHAMQNESSVKLRHEKRFINHCSPLLLVNWWRLCLDEAQMVEVDGSAINQMSKLIPAVNRWSVSGTPIQKSMNDLYHLLDFLRIEPYTDKSLWNALLYVPYVNGNKIPMYSTVSQIFWRNSKEDIADELFIPEQKIKYHFLRFTAVEQNFYMREHNVSSLEFAEYLRRSQLDVTTTIDSLDKNTLSKLLNPLLNLRQACSHPLAVKGNKISTKTGSMTMTDLFKYLHKKTKVECEEELRKYIAALNGMAGVLCIQEEWVEAVEYYRKVLQVSEEYKKNVHVDSLQLIHTLTNLAEILEYYKEYYNIPSTLRDESLKDKAKQLEDKYMEKVLEDFKSGQKTLAELSAKVNEIENNFSTHSEVWWVHLIITLMAHDAIEEVTDKVSTELLIEQVDNKKNVDIFLSKLTSPKSIELYLRNWLKNVEENRSKVKKQLEFLEELSCDNLVSEAVDCHLRTTSSPFKKNKCGLCVCENDLLDYECCLFAVSRKDLKAEYEKILDGAQTKGSWKAHKAERVLRVILNVAKNKSSTHKWALTDGKNHMNLLEALKKEFKQLRVVWMSLNHHVQARDEVNMCKLRLRLRFPGEPLPPKPAKLNLKEQCKVETIYIIQHHEVEAQSLKLTGEIEISKSEFRKKYGTLLYLDNVGKKENATPEPCPICKTALDNEWCVLQCGHSYCIDCIRILLMRNCKPSINCPVCREVTKSSNLSFIDLSGREENCDIKVVGEHSTKIEAVVRTLLELKRNDENVKVLIFSTWAVVLKVLAVALDENGISFRRMPGHKYQTQLKEFKDPKLNVTALLLPLAWGSKGLNLIEATHVFLVEPIMNPVEELQALGRVHRMGQLKETFVHQFLIKGTIEEKIYSAVSNAKDKWDKKKVTLEDLKNLFDIKQNLVKPNEQLIDKDDN